ncbi:tetraacyldisaccharide 4'-kinase [gut metagenome]|uniref:tetraacyldisaccharide 4'-kinase n=1 Tax=gut metagenome TaxID=749906 RepID=J9G4Z0_9ZZZZ
MTEKNFHIHYYLLPLSWIYGWGVSIRNKLFDLQWKKSRSFDLPVICIGNLSVGGTGKTPHTEYLIRLLQQEGWHVATLSRGYKRHTKGYYLATTDSTAAEIGDEPCQMKRKFPDVQISVDEDRCHGIEKLLQLNQPPIDVILLDDAFQHRAVKAGLNILLTDYNRLFSDDCLLPAGHLREPICGKNRAQIVIVTKCPNDIKPIDFNIISKKLNLYPYQKLFFSSFCYGELTALFPLKRKKTIQLAEFSGEEEVLLVTGIASPAPLVQKIKSLTPHVKLMEFGDHHDFSAHDIHQIYEQFMKLKEGKRYLITTEKDAVRLVAHPNFSEALKPWSYVLPIKIEILQNQQHNFNQNIISYVRTHQRNSSLPKE